MSAKTDFQGKFSNQHARHSGVAELAGDVWDLKAPTSEVLTAARTIAMSDSGKVFYMKGTAGANITLPAVAASAGFRARFYVGGAFATTSWTITGATAVIQGGAIVNSTYVPGAAESLITFAYGAETVGDYIDLDCDGTNWYANGMAAAAGGITFTAP